MVIVGYSVVRRHFCRVGFAGGRCELRQQGGCPGPVGVETVRGFLQYPDKIAVRVKPVLLCNQMLVVYNQVRTSVLFQQLNRRPDGMVEMKQAA